MPASVPPSTRSAPLRSEHPLYRARCRARREYDRIRKALLACGTRPKRLLRPTAEVLPEKARRILSAARPGWPNLATRFVYLHHTAADIAWTAHVFRLVRTAASPEGLAGILEAMPTEGLPLAPGMVLARGTISPLADYLRIARALLRDLKTGRAPHDPEAEPDRAFGNVATREVFQHFAAEQGRPSRLRDQIIADHAARLGQQCPRDLRPLLPLVNWQTVAEKLIFGAPGSA